MDSMCQINRRFILNICVRSVNIWVTTVVVCRSNSTGLSSHHCASLLMEALHINSLQWVLRLGLCERFVIKDEALPVFLRFKENNSIRERKRNNWSWQTTLADRKYECCQELELILSSKIQVEACIPHPAPVVATIKPLRLYTCTGNIHVQHLL